jgi:hypothetical protein
MSPSAAFWSTTTFVVSGSFLPFAMSDSRRSTRKMMSMARDLLLSPIMARGAGDYRRPRAPASAAVTALGTIDVTSPPKLAISFTRLELT